MGGFTAALHMMNGHKNFHLAVRIYTSRSHKASCNEEVLQVKLQLLMFYKAETIKRCLL